MLLSIRAKEIFNHMNKRVFIAHGWDGYPEEGWFPWLKKELETKGFEVSEIIIKQKMGHFSGSNGINELPIALESVLKIAQ